MDEAKISILYAEDDEFGAKLTKTILEKRILKSKLYRMVQKPGRLIRSGNRISSCSTWICRGKTVWK